MPRSYNYDDVPDFLRPRQEAAPAPRIPVSARPEPEGVNILDNHRRVGEVQRNTYLEHLSDLHARGYLPAEEFEARQAAVQNAEVEYDLNRLISDTPGLVEPKAASVRRALRSPAALISWFAANKKSRALATIFFLLWGFATVAWMSIVPATLGLYAPKLDAFQIAGIVFFIVTGVISVIGLVVTLVNYCEGY